VAIGRTSAKKRDCLDNLGADYFIAMTEDQDWAAKNAASLDLIISTSDSADMPMPELLGLLRINGSFVTAGVSFDPLTGINTFMLCSAMIRIEGSFWGSYREINDMLQFAALNAVRPVIQEHQLEEANQIIMDQCAGKAKYKYVLQVK
jgi:alcohol dehydrogenase (NADP+)